MNLFLINIVFWLFLCKTDQLFLINYYLIKTIQKYWTTALGIGARRGIEPCAVERSTEARA